ncbi:VapE domain-containing protein [Bernardetia sp. Wsw4-3y2]|uniref:VapE domain-containing protein n=1 Tax=Bernardetia sp. Wsw4-3y2 TaxID=3127471 RepID=UPI0030D06233
MKDEKDKKEVLTEYEKEMQELYKFNKMPEIVSIKIYLNKTYDFRYNIINNEIQIKKKNTEESEFEDVAFADLFCELLEKGFKITDQLLTVILQSSFVEKVDFFEKYFEDLEWNGNDEIQKLASYVNVKEHDKERFYTQFRKFLVRSVACSLDAGYFNKQCLTIIGKQNDGKSTFCEFLAPPFLAEFLQRGLNGDGKDQQITLTNNFIINLDELATFGKFELNSLKSMFSQAYVKVRPPFGKKAIRAQRRANFVASTNEKDFLTDPTGSVRWLCFEIDSINFAYSKEVDINQVWAQAYSYYKKQGAQKFEMTREEIQENERANKQFSNNSIEEDLLQKYFTPSTKTEPTAEFFTATDFLTTLHELEPTIRLKKVPVGKAAISLNFERTKKAGIYGYYATRRFGTETEQEEQEQKPLTKEEKKELSKKNGQKQKYGQKEFDINKVPYTTKTTF